MSTPSPQPSDFPTSKSPWSISPLILDPVTRNPNDPQHAPNSWFGGPIVRFDGLAADTPPRSRLEPLPVLFNPLLRLVFFLVVGFALAVLSVVGFALLAPRALFSGFTVASVVAQILLVVATYQIVVVLVERRRPPVELAPRRALGLVWGLLGGALAFGLVYLVITAFGGLRFDGAAEVNWSHWWLQVLITGASAGIIEEIVFRGILFRITEEITGTWIAAALSGLIFGAAHVTNPDATVWSATAIALEAGILLGLLYAFTRSLWIVIGFHTAWNIVQGPVLGVIVSGTGGAPSLFRTSTHGVDIISGGAFGAEASLITVLLMVGLTLAIGWALVKWRAVVAPMWVRRARQRAALEQHADSVH